MSLPMTIIALVVVTIIVTSEGKLCEHVSDARTRCFSSMCHSGGAKALTGRPHWAWQGVSYCDVCLLRCS